MKHRVLLSLLGSLLPLCLTAQPRPSTPAEVQSAAQTRQALRQSSILKAYPARAIGPVEQGGRVTDIDVDPRNDQRWYVGYASGGLFKTENNGQSFISIFDEQGAMGIGDFALSPANPDHIWVGTGESNSSRSSYAGNGVYKSTDAGKTWTHQGLEATQHIGRIIPHPTDPNTIWVAAMGNLYSSNPDRGIFRTTDGGSTWQKTLFVNDRTGAIDLIIDPFDPDRLWAGMWERDRKAWEFDEDGPGSGIYRSTDKGSTWQRLTTGLPSGETVGRWGLDISLSQSGLLYAVLDNQEPDPRLAREDTIADLTARKIASMSLDDFLKLPDDRLNTFLDESGYPSKYKAPNVKEDLKAGKYTLKDLAHYFGDANNALFQTTIKGTELYRSTDHGDTWTKVHPDPLTGVFYTYGYYFGQVKIAPDRPEELYVYGVPLIKSTDAGRNWHRLDSTDEIHVDHHALWLNPKNPSHILLGNDGGLYVSYDRGAHWTHLNNLPVGQFYTLAVDMDEPYNVYGGLQDNGTMRGSSRTVPNKGAGWTSIGGGDGMCVVIDTKVPGQRYTGFQFGNYYRTTPGKRSAYITPKHDIGAPKYRWNWRTPLIASPHNHEILYIGSQYLHRSMDMGETWETLSPDLTTNRQPQGNVPYSTITTISESPLKFGLLWIGTDDGKVQLSTDGGNTWQDRSAGLPQGLWVSSLQASPHDKATAHLSLTGYRADDFHAYLYRTTDYGLTWTDLRANLPQEAVNSLIQDPVLPDLLYCGTDHATYTSWDKGTTWTALSQVPNVAAYELLIHPRDHELIIGTHGRSIYVVDLKPLHAIAKRKSDQTLVAFTPPKMRWSKHWGKRDHPYEPFDLPTANFRFFLTAPPSQPVTIKVLDDKGKTLHTWTTTAQQGWNTTTWDLKIKEKGKETFLPAGKYTLEYSMGPQTQKQDWEIKE